MKQKKIYTKNRRRTQNTNYNIIKNNKYSRDKLNNSFVEKSKTSGDLFIIKLKQMNKFGSLKIKIYVYCLWNTL